MLLEKGFYKVHAITPNGAGKYAIDLLLNEKHAIFAGHFPGNPVTPGACMLQVVKELTESIMGAKLMMTNASNVKFMALINPETHPLLRLELEILPLDQQQLRVKNTTLFEDTTALKMSTTYKILN